MRRGMFTYLRFLIAFIGLTTLATIIILFRNVQQADYAKLLVPAQIDFFEIRENLSRSSGGGGVAGSTATCYENLYQYANFIECLQKNGQVFVSFDYVRRKFDVHGRRDRRGRFQLTYSFANAHWPDKLYDPDRDYLWFHLVDVEPRDRVKYFSGLYNVPISAQWNASGHFYPIQIAQYGLSHLSKLSYRRKLQTKPPSATEKQEKEAARHHFNANGTDKWIHHENQRASVVRLVDGFEFHFPDKAIYKTSYKFDMRYFVGDVFTRKSFDLVFDLMLRDPKLRSGNYIVRLVYSVEASVDSARSEHVRAVKSEDKTFEVAYKIRHASERPFRFVRNLCIDACKGLGLKCDNCLKPLNETIVTNNDTADHLFTSFYYKVYQIALVGEGEIRNGLLLEEAPHLEMARQAGEYLLDAQSSTTGGWSMNVTKRFDNRTSIQLRPGWHSAMAQGQAISLLCRLYALSNDTRYLRSAARALDLFDVSVDAQSTGVRSLFLNSSALPWYEEYPTKPTSLHVLNGFIYSLIGLRDFVEVCGSPGRAADSTALGQALRLYSDGLRSLRIMLNFYDTGSRSLYDLRHVNNPALNPNLARWDYHMLHVSQLNYLADIIERSRIVGEKSSTTDAAVLRQVAKRWMGYSQGKMNQNSQIKSRN